MKNEINKNFTYCTYFIKDIFLASSKFSPVFSHYFLRKISSNHLFLIESSAKSISRNNSLIFTKVLFSLSFFSEITETSSKLIFIVIMLKRQYFGVFCKHSRYVLTIFLKTSSGATVRRCLHLSVFDLERARSKQHFGNIGQQHQHSIKQVDLATEQNNEK